MSAQDEEGPETCEEKKGESDSRGSFKMDSGLKSMDSNKRGKENLDENVTNKKNPDDQFLCHECKRSLSSSPELINIAGHPCRQWHPDCFKCIICREPMDKRQSCHVYEDQIVCRADYMRLKRDTNSVKCARCRWPIGATDWVRKAAQHVYHLACFNCDICSRQLNTGEQFIISSVESNPNDQSELPIRLLCRLHFTVDLESRRSSRDFAASERSGGCEATLHPEQVAKASQEDEKDDGLRDKCWRHIKRNHLGSQKSNLTPSTSAGGNEGTSMIMAQPSDKQEHSGFQFGPSIGKDLSIVTCLSHQHHPSSANASPSTTSSSNNTTLLGCGGSELGGPATPTGDQSGCSGGGSSPSKSKRVRTTFTEDQLSILQTHFQIDSNPDGQDLERIATITGLSKRVTQVWFQNSRARQKKYMIKRKPMHAIAALQGHAHHTMELAGPRDENDNDGSSSHVRTFDELTPFHRRGDLLVAGLEQLQRRCEALDGLTATTNSEQASWHEGAEHADEDRLSSSSSLSSEVDTAQGIEKPSAVKSQSTPRENLSND